MLHGVSVSDVRGNAFDGPPNFFTEASGGGFDALGLS
jgi:hypothetical protein